MAVKTIAMSWISVADVNKTKEFFTKNFGLKVACDTPEFGWAELAAESGARLGVGQENPKDGIKAGSNAIVCLTVENLSATIDKLKANNVTLIGDIVEVPGHVKMQLIQDLDGNLFHVVQDLS